MFVDHARVVVLGGRGGDGCLSFRREKFVPKGGPDGGDGGDGGRVIFVTDASLTTLQAFRFRQHFRAAKGGHGRGKNQHGRGGADLRVAVPAGTVIHDETGAVIVDLSETGHEWVAAKGGHGGRGNARFASSTNQAPRRFEPGTPGEERTLVLELKLLADVGLVGMPNAGKSTLLSRISSARPKIADYPFTTLTPHLGVVESGPFESFVVADIPGLIEGAHEGAGLGARFLRHVERTSVLVHLVDISAALERDPVEDLSAIERELMEAGGLNLKPRLVVATKVDLVPGIPEAEAALARLKSHCRRHKLPFASISAATGSGIRELVAKIDRMLRKSIAGKTESAPRAIRLRSAAPGRDASPGREAASEREASSKREAGSEDEE
ncbi:MAG: GTPase ObgE [Acidobacteria bacterium]|nr:GTPase ObgE [Acidobacteriota bacterium]